ncbi:hypothetical protein NW759_016855 [Fusarium solani]|nr:hypothetical protein NW759_016855 [Fusarium solani]
MGILMAGGIFTGASPAVGPAELARQLKDSGALFLIAGSAGLQVALEAASHSSLSKGRVFSFDGSLQGATIPSQAGVNHWTTILADATEAERFDWVEPLDPRSTTCCLNYSSGTTGIPKGVEITHHAYVANGQVNVHINHMDPSWHEQLKTRSSLCFMPMYHAAGQTTFVANHPKMLIPTYIMPRYNFEKLLQHIQDFKITSIATAPPILLSIAKSPLTAKYNLSSVKEIVCGTAPLPPEIAQTVQRKLWPNGESFVRQGWGMTEFTCTGSLWSYGDDEKPSSVGEIVPNASLKIMDGDSEITVPNQPGELWITGPTLMKGYWQNPGATAETIAEEKGVRWLKTGDIAYVDRFKPGAKIFLTDRIKELIKVRGFQVSPAELEATLLTYGSVVDAGVVGVVINGEEVPRAYVVRNSDVTEQEIEKWMEGQVAKYKWLRGGVVFVDSIPRIQSGKILRRVLREMAKREVVGTKAKLA